MIARAILSGVAAALACGAQVCEKCHPAEVKHTQQATMTRALEKATESSILVKNPRLAASIGGVSYEIVRTAGAVSYAVSDGKEGYRVPIQWAFGQGSAGQTYLYQVEGRWYESRVSFFSALGGLDLTMGAQNIQPHSLKEAAGRRLAPRESTECFGCHSTGEVPGVRCERCHGPDEGHVKSGTAMKKLTALSTEEMSDFCGQCHRTWSQIASDGPRGIQNVRFQPYRLGNSKCYDVADARIRCTACHDPHGALEVSAAAYDSKCLACHSRTALATKASARICKIAAKDCTSCHMARLDLPGAHKKFTDHMIRVVNANERYPE